MNESSTLGTPVGPDPVVPRRALPDEEEKRPFQGQAPAFSPATVLVVDDLAPNALALAAILNPMQIRVRCAHSGSEALECLLREDVALALIDVHMPEMDGFQLAEAMRSVERTRYVPIIFVTAATSDQRRAFKGYESGGIDFLYKPLDAHVIRSKVDAFVQLHRVRAELAQRVEQLNEVIRLNDIFTAVLGHDLRNPLGAMINAAHAISMMTSDASMRSMADRIHRSGGRMSRLIDQVLDICRMRTGAFALSVAQADMRSILGDACSDAELGPAQIQIHSKGDSCGVWDADRLTQLFVNLLTNARQHGVRDEPIEVEIDGTEAAAVSVDVRNTGVIDPDQLDTLFDPFHTNTNASKHLGLGLFIARQLAIVHGGNVFAHVDGRIVSVTVRVPRESLEARVRT
jgi:signal transduction histidine kinase